MPAFPFPLAFTLLLLLFILCSRIPPLRPPIHPMKSHTLLFQLPHHIRKIHPLRAHGGVERFGTRAEASLDGGVWGALFDRIVSEGLDVRACLVIRHSQAVHCRNPSSLALLQDIKDFQYAIGAPERCPFPAIVAVHGLVLGLGIDIISACDVRYAAEGSQFSIKMAYSATIFSVADAERMGLISRVVPGGRTKVVAAALALAGVIAGKSPIAVSGTKRIFLHSEYIRGGCECNSSSRTVSPGVALTRSSAVRLEGCQCDSLQAVDGDSHRRNT
ncbi:ClpP/crotonase-like domain-containing protein [Mycena albidolilacea]|uniref:ClpP/crotonase-like domain-containing protein n=1 Tax=Mycena albidolilacea TaxID=1033008 RepID=A0AAD6YYQ3_9AGAR|nr:ClpP/crotonase-like domain-containing protein [Mycena albidolilacea]